MRVFADQKPVFTRYFVFTRVDPRDLDYERLRGVCEMIDAHLAYKTVRDASRIRLIGCLVLRGPRTVADDIGCLLPNFLVTAMTSDVDDIWHWFEVSSSKTDGSFFIDGEIFFNNHSHPFDDLKRVLFS